MTKPCLYCLLPCKEVPSSYLICQTCLGQPLFYYTGNKLDTVIFSFKAAMGEWHIHVTYDLLLKEITLSSHKMLPLVLSAWEDPSPNHAQVLTNKINNLLPFL